MMSDPGDSSVLVLVRDLIFSSRITATAKAEGVSVVTIREPAQLAGRTGTRLIVDLNQAGAIEASADWARSSGGEVIGFVSHVDSETIVRAREAGITRVMPRSRFVEQLPQLLRTG